MMHTLSYCTKATFTDIEWDEALASNLSGERYSGWWGKWDAPPKWQLDPSDKKTADLSMLEQGLHPVSGKPIRWHKKPIPFVLVLMEDPVSLGNGYYTLPPIRPPPPWAVRPTNLYELPDGDPRKHSNRVKRLIEKARDINSLLDDASSGCEELDGGW
ncbi:hypothetical protein ES705_35122 [subsurface metagenome]